MANQTTTTVQGTATVKEAPNANFLVQYLQYTPKGQVDLKATMKSIEENLRGVLAAHEALKPTIIAELKEYKRIGNANLCNYVLHTLKMHATGENVSRVELAIKDLEAAGAIVYQTSEGGAKKGRTAGWILSPNAAV